MAISSTAPSVVSERNPESPGALATVDLLNSAAEHAEGLIGIP